ncbi:MAG: hypothetical protein HYW78_01105 [Parcubacteria group bacterium]|nr:hypothetical protein [Parcubacteria group bacterium]
MLDDTSTLGNLLLEWHFKEYEEYQRSRRWYIGAFVAVIAILTYAIATANLLFAVFIILAVFLAVTRQRALPRDLALRIFERGIVLGEKYYPWSDIKSFSIIYNPPETKLLYIDLKNIFAVDFSIPLNSTNPLIVRTTLLRYLPEDTTRETESLNDTIGRWLRI